MRLRVADQGGPPVGAPWRVADAGRAREFAYEVVCRIAPRPENPPESPDC